MHHYEIQDRNPVQPKACGRFKHPISLTCPLCPQLDSALHILSVCQHTQMRNVITERHNLACSIILKAISKTGSLGLCLVCINIGTSERLATQNLQISVQLKLGLDQSGSFHPAFQTKIGLPLPSGCCTGCSHLRKNKKSNRLAI